MIQINNCFFHHHSFQFKLDLEREPLPNEIPAVEQLIADHKEFMENTARRQPEVDRACKPKTPPAGTKEPSSRKPSRQLKTPVYVQFVILLFILSSCPSLALFA